jgi:hypothetical protein
VSVPEAPMKRFNNFLPWVAALVLVAGIAAVLGLYFSNTAKVEKGSPSRQVIPAEVPQKNIPFPEEAWKVAREFAFTAVARKHLAESYAITHPTARAGYTLKQWETGTLPNIAFFPTAQIVKYNWKKTNYAHPREAFVNVFLIAAKASHRLPVPAQIGLRKVGTGSNARWMVDYFSALGGMNPIGKQ